MRHLTSVLFLAALALILCGNLQAQPGPNMTATLASADVPIGKDIVIDYVTQPSHNGQILVTLWSLYSGYTPVGFGFLLPLAPPLNIMGYSMVANNKANFRFNVPMNPGLVGINLYMAGLVTDGTPSGTGVSNNVLCTIRQEDWPLP